MNKMTKLGVSALCGSLAAISAANAGELTVTGGVDMSWVSLENETTGNPIGMGSNLTFKGSGELDNGTTIALTVANTNAAGYSNTNVTLTTPSMGVFRIDHGTSGTGLDALDDKTPTAWEETWGTAVTTGIDLVDGVATGTNIQWTPSSDMLPDGISGTLTWAPHASGMNAADKTSSGDSGDNFGSGFDVVANIDFGSFGVDGLTLHAGMSNIDYTDEARIHTGDRSEYALHAVYAINNFTLGYGETRENIQTRAGGGVSGYDNTMWGVSFNVNDDLSISYGNLESTKVVMGGTDVTSEASSVQVAYTVGGASWRLAETTADNVSYNSAAGEDNDGTTISVSLAF
jgi:hypothetical protein